MPGSKTPLVPNLSGTKLTEAKRHSCPNLLALVACGSHSSASQRRKLLCDVLTVRHCGTKSDSRVAALQALMVITQKLPYSVLLLIHDYISHSFLLVYRS